MFKKIKAWLKKRELEFEILKGNLEIIQKLLVHKPDSIEAVRHALGSIDLFDIEDEEVSETERREYCASISGIYPRLEKDIKKFLYTQLLFSSNQAMNWESVIFGRGTFNGMDLLLEHWKKADEEHREKLKPKEDFDRHNPIGEINEK